MSYTELKMLIDGEWTVGTSGKSEDVIDPATNEVLGQVPHASEADLDRALAAAQRGFEEWSNMLPFARQQIMEQAARNLEANKQDIARWCTMEMGKPLAESLIEMDFVIANTRWCGEVSSTVFGNTTSGRAWLRPPMTSVAWVHSRRIQSCWIGWQRSFAMGNNR